MSVRDLGDETSEGFQKENATIENPPRHSLFQPRLSKTSISLEMHLHIHRVVYRDDSYQIIVVVLEALGMNLCHFEILL